MTGKINSFGRFILLGGEGDYSTMQLFLQS